MFLPHSDHSRLSALAISSAGITVVAQGMGMAVQMIATVVLARLLAPTDFGIVAMVTLFSVLLVSFGQIGLQEAVVQRDKIDHFLLSNLFWLNIATGIFLTIGFAFAGSLLAGFYDDPRVTKLAVGLSLTIFLTSLSVLHLGLLKRAMRFSLVAVIEILARTCSVVVSILFGLTGWGYWALVAGAIAQPFATFVGAWALCRWIPTFPRRVAGTGSLVQFAIHVNMSWNIDYVARNLDNFLVGWQFGSNLLGFYKKAYDLFTLPANLLLSVTPVAVSTLSQLQREPVAYRRYFLSGLSVLAFLGMGVGADLTLIGKDLVRFILGPGWEESGEMFMFFGPGIGIMLIYRLFIAIHLSIGTTGRFLHWRIIEFTVTVVLFLYALPWGPKGLALAWTVSYWILVIPAYWYAGRPIELSIAPVITAVWKYGLASLVAACATAVIFQGLPPLISASGWLRSLTQTVATTLLFGVLYIFAVVIFFRGLTPIHQFTELLQQMIPWRIFSRLSTAVSGEKCDKSTALS